MAMIWVIARKELLVNLLTFRFAFSLAACVVLMGLSAYALVNDYGRRLEAYRAELVKVEKELAKDRVYVELEVSMVRPPSPLSLFSEGMEKRLGNILRLSHAQVPTMLTWHKETNPLMDAFPAFDLATIAQLLFSLMALFFAYDSISGEREANTLRLIGAHAVPRWQVLAGKWVGGMWSATLPALAGFAVALLVVVNAPLIRFSGDEWVRIGLIIAASVLYISLFFTLGMGISAHVRQSATGLVVAILGWMVATVIAPTGIAYAVGEVMPLPDAARLEARTAQMDKAYAAAFFAAFNQMRARDYGGEIMGIMELNAKAPVGAYVSIRFPHSEAVPHLTAFYREMEPRRMELGEQIAQLQQQLIGARQDQAEKARQVGRLFLGPAFTHAVAALAATDVASYRDFVRHARQYRRALIRSMSERELFASIAFFSPTPAAQVRTKEATLAWWNELRKDKEAYSRMHRTWEDLELDIPKLQEYRPQLRALAGGALGDLAVLLGANLLCGYWALRGFVRRDLV